jgi:polyisoprenoid-binding protein YceI
MKGPPHVKNSTKKALFWILAPVLALVVIGGAGVFWMLSGSSAAPLALKAAGSSSLAASAGDLSGQWAVVPGPAEEPTTAGYRVEEKVAGGLVSDTATGRTGDVTGSVTVVGNRVVAAHFTVNMTTLKSDKSLRDTVLKTNAIQTAKYPTAAFALADPIVLPDITPGKVYKLDAHGKLLLHGVTKSVTVAVHYEQTNTGFVLLADMPIVMADYAIKAPSIAGVVSVQNHGSFELLVNLAK